MHVPREQMISAQYLKKKNYESWSDTFIIKAKIKKNIEIYLNNFVLTCFSLISYNVRLYSTLFV